MFLTGRFIIPPLFTTHLAIPFPRIRIPYAFNIIFDQWVLVRKSLQTFVTLMNHFVAFSCVCGQSLYSLLLHYVLLQCPCATFAFAQHDGPPLSNPVSGVIKPFALYPIGIALQCRSCSTWCTYGRWTSVISRR